MKAILLIFTLSASSLAWCQVDSVRVAEVRAIVDQLFDGMRQSDSSMLREVFHKNAQTYTSHKRDGAYELHQGSVEKLIEVVGTPRDKVWDEHISNVVIQIDDGLAHVWMDYSFYLGDEFSHKGVNSMTVVEVDGRWQILTIIDTRRKN